MEFSPDIAPRLSPQTEYVSIPEYLGVGADGQQFRVGARAKSLSLNLLFKNIDDLFLEFIANRETESDKRNYWREIIEKAPLSEALEKFYSEGKVPQTYRRFFGDGFNFKEEKILTPTELVASLLKLSRIEDLVCEVLHTEREARAKGGSPISHATRVIFNDDFSIFDTPTYAGTVEDFFCYLLREKFFTREESAQEISTKKRVSASLLFMGNMQDLLSALVVIPTSDADSKLRNDLLHRVLALYQSHTETELQGLNQALEVFEPQAANFLEQIEALIANVSPRLSEHEFAEPQIRVFKLGRTSYLLPSDNFVFESTIEPDSSEEWSKFPEDGRCLGSKSAIQREILVAKTFDINIFDPDGFKVFWGDLKVNEIKDIKGPFYVLDSESAYSDIPMSMVKSQNESRDSYRESLTGNRDLPALSALASHPENSDSSPVNLGPKKEASRIDVHYMKANALGKIINGVFLENSIELPTIVVPSSN